MGSRQSYARQQGHFECVFLDCPRINRHVIRLRARSFRYDALETSIPEMRGNRILDGIAWLDLAALHQRVIRGPAIGFAVIVRTAAAGEKTQTVERAQAISPRIGDPLFEPANRARALAAEDDAGIVGSFQDLRQSPFAP